MVKSLHAAGIAVVLDIVFNHTAEGNERGPTYSFRGIDNAIYYLIDPQTGTYRDYTGCGNTLNCNHPRVRDLIIDVLRYWVAEMHVDGFRFDLASVLGRGLDGSVLANPPIIERIAEDARLAADGADRRSVGCRRPVPSRPLFRDRAAGRSGTASSATTCAASSRATPAWSRPWRPAWSAARICIKHSGRRPYHSLNFVTCHDGFTLADLVAYNGKHNEANGEGNADGSNDNLSWNCGAEGPTDAEEINRLRRRQMRNFATILLLSAGTPMILAGDEFGRTQCGNNNAYCQDNETQLGRLAPPRSQRRSVPLFQAAHPVPTGASAVAAGRLDLDEEDRSLHIAWHGTSSWGSRTGPGSPARWRCISTASDGGETEDIYFIANAHWEETYLRAASPVRPPLVACR